MDVRFDEYMADQMAVLHRVYELAGVDLTDDAERLLRTAIDDRPRGRHGRVAYHLEDVGIDAGRAPGRPPPLPGALRRALTNPSD